MSWDLPLRPDCQVKMFTFAYFIVILLHLCHTYTKARVELYQRICQWDPWDYTRGKTDGLVYPYSYNIRKLVRVCHSVACTKVILYPSVIKMSHKSKIIQKNKNSYLTDRLIERLDLLISVLFLEKWIHRNLILREKHRKALNNCSLSFHIPFE